MRVVRNRFAYSAACAVLMITLLRPAGFAAAKVHVIAFGKWTSAQWYPNGLEEKPGTIKIRGLLVDGRVKEYVMGSHTR